MKIESLKVGDHPLPQLRYDGVMGEWLQFTEYDRSSAAHGASIYVNAAVFTVERLQAKRDAKRLEFETQNLFASEMKRLYGIC